MKGLLSISGNEQSDRPAGGTSTAVPGIDRERLPAPPFPQSGWAMKAPAGQRLAIAVIKK